MAESMPTKRPTGIAVTRIFSEVYPHVYALWVDVVNTFLPDSQPYLFTVG